MPGQLTKKLTIISFKLKILQLCIWSLCSSTIKSVLKKKNKTAHTQVIVRRLIAETDL